MGLCELGGIGRPVEAATFVAALALRHVAQAYLVRRKVKGARSGYASTALLFICYVSAMLLAFAGLARGKTPLAAGISASALWLAAVAFRMWALRHLAEQFSSLIEIREQHRLVVTGPYAVTRHPLHLAFGLEVTAFAPLAWSVYAVAPAALVWIVILVRNRTEEEALARHFGEEYGRYRARVPSMNVVLGLFRLARLGRRR